MNETEPLVLVIEDEEQLRGLVRLVLASAGYRALDESTPELLARVRVALRNEARLDRDSPLTLVAIGEEVTVDLVRRVVTRRGEEVHLTPLEYKLLIALVRHADMVVTHRQLLEQVWGPGCTDRVEYLRVYMTQLRHKLEPIPAQPRFLRTELGVGYRLKCGGGPTS